MKNHGRRRIFTQALPLWVILLGLLIGWQINPVHAGVSVSARVDIFVGPKDDWLDLQRDFHRVAADPETGRFLVVWQHFETNDYGWGQYSILGRLIQADGSPLGEPLQIYAPPFSSRPVYAYSPQPAYDSVNRRFLVIWTDNRGGANQVTGRLVETDGSMPAPDFRISPEINREFEHCGTVYDHLRGRFLVLMQDGYNLFGRFVNHEGSLVGASFPITDFELIPGNDISYLSGFDTANGNFMLVYHAPYTGRGGLILDGDGQPLKEFPVPDGLFAFSPIAFDPVNSRFLFHRSIPNLPYLCLQLVDTDGSLVGEPVNVSDDPPFNYLDATFDAAAQKFMIVWGTQDWVYSINRRIVGRHFNLDGTPAGSPFLVAAILAYPRQPFVVWNPQGNNALVVYQDASVLRENSHDIFGNLVKLLPDLPARNMAFLNLLLME